MPVRWQLAPATRGGIATAMRGKGLALAALAALTATVAFAAECRTQRPEARIAVAQTIVAEAASQTAVQIQTGPSDAIPANSFIRLRGLPASVSLSDGYAIGPGSWAIPLQSLPALKAHHPGRRLGPLGADHQPGQRRRHPAGRSAYRVRGRPVRHDGARRKPRGRRPRCSRRGLRRPVRCSRARPSCRPTRRSAPRSWSPRASVSCRRAMSPSPASSSSARPMRASARPPCGWPPPTIRASSAGCRCRA